MDHIAVLGFGYGNKVFFFYAAALKNIPCAFDGFDYIPIYSQTEGFSSKQLDKLIQNAINDVLPEIIDPLPEEIRTELSLPTLTRAIKSLHFPESDEDLSIRF